MAGRRDVRGLGRRRRLARGRCGCSRRGYCRYPGTRGLFGRPGFRSSCVGSFRNFTRHLGVARPELRDVGFQFLDLPGHRGEILRHRLQLRQLREGIAKGRSRRCGGLFRLGRGARPAARLSRPDLLPRLEWQGQPPARRREAFPRETAPRARIAASNSQPSPWRGRHSAATRQRRWRHTGRASP